MQRRRAGARGGRGCHAMTGPRSRMARAARARVGAFPRTMETSMPRLPRSLAAAGLGLSLAIGSLAAPAPALAQELDLPRVVQENPAAATLAALAALGIIAALVDDDDDDDDRRRDRDDFRYDEGRERVEVYRRAPELGHEPAGRVLPADCVRRLDGGERVLAGQCLEQRGYYAAGLPGHCRASVYSGGHYRPIYDMRCLRGSGYYVR